MDVCGIRKGHERWEGEVDAIRPKAFRLLVPVGPLVEPFVDSVGGGVT